MGEADQDIALCVLGQKHWSMNSVIALYRSDSTAAARRNCITARCYTIAGAAKQTSVRLICHVSCAESAPEMFIGFSLGVKGGNQIRGTNRH